MMMLESISITAQEYCVVFVAFIDLIFNLERPSAHAARGGDSGQCCRQCCDDYTHNNLPHILLFIHSFQKLITLFWERN